MNTAANKPWYLVAIGLEDEKKMLRGSIIGHRFHINAMFVDVFDAIVVVVFGFEELLKQMIEIRSVKPIQLLQEKKKCQSHCSWTIGIARFFNSQWISVVHTPSSSPTSMSRSYWTCVRRAHFLCEYWRPRWADYVHWRTFSVLVYDTE